MRLSDLITDAKELARIRQQIAWINQDFFYWIDGQLRWTCNVVAKVWVVDTNDSLVPKGKI